MVTGVVVEGDPVGHDAHYDHSGDPDEEVADEQEGRKPGANDSHGVRRRVVGFGLRVYCLVSFGLFETSIWKWEAIQVGGMGAPHL